ncbi:hypothetical protein pb186bvf_016548 [Paramecium bursaria]
MSETAQFKPVGRTLPREIMKWIQGLDLSYSVRDPKKDLSNGFLIAEMFSRYHPGLIQMHSFDNSHNRERRENNFRQLELFFTKNNIKIGGFKEILDYNWDALYNFIIQVYTQLTERKIMNPPLATYVNSKEFATSTQNTQSFLLKDKGIEKLQEEQRQDEQKELSEKHAPLSVSSKRTNFLRIPSKPISQNIENLNYQIDVKNISIRPVQGSIMKLKEEHQQQQISSNQERNIQDSFQKTPIEDNKREVTSTREKQQDKSIYDILNEQLVNRQQLPQFSQVVVFPKTIPPLQSFVALISDFNEDFVSGFFQDITNQKEAYINFIFKDTNEIWKFFSFTFQCIANLPIERVKSCVDLVIQFGQKAMQKDPLKTRSLFLEFFLPEICILIKQSIYFEKRHLLIQMVQSFQEPHVKHQIISIMKTHLAMEHFLQCLVVFSESETESSDLWPEMIRYGMTYLLNQSCSLSTSAIAILANAAKANSQMLKIDKFVMQIARNNWWQYRCLAVILFSEIIRGIIKTPNYQNLIKSPQQGQKFFSIENDRIISDLKQQVSHYAKGIELASYPSSSEFITITTLINIVDIIGDSKILLELFTKIILQIPLEMRNWALFSEEGPDQYEFIVQSEKAFKFKTNIDSKIIRGFSFQILTHLIEQIKLNKYPTLPIGHFQLLHWCFQYTDFKIQNMESCETIANVSKGYVFLGLTDPQILLEAVELARQLLDLQFKSEVQMADNDKILASCIDLALKTESEEVIHNMVQFLDQIIDDSLQGGSESLKSFMRNVQDHLSQTKPSPLENPDIHKCFERLGQIPRDMELSAVQNQDEQQSDYQY